MATYYISPTGNDTTGTGTILLPWLTVSKAHTSASNGDIIVPMAGTHTWLTQAFTKTITIAGITPTTTKFDAGSISANQKWNTTANITLQDITFQNNGPTAYAPQLFSSNTAASRPIITYNRCTFQNLQYGGTVSGSWGSSIFGNTNSSNEMRCGHTFVTCLFYNIASSASGGYIFGFGSNTGSADSFFSLSNCSLYLDTSAYVALTAVFYLGQASQTATLTNCAFKTMQALAFKAGGGTATATYCAFNNFTTPPTGTGVITTDPLFIDGANADFRLRPTSPCLGTGTLI